MRILWIDQFKKLRQRPYETIIMSIILFVIVSSFMIVHPLSTRLDDNVDDYLNTQQTEDFHISMGMIDFNHLTGAQRLDVYQTMNLYARFPALDEDDPYQMNRINMVIAEEIYQYPNLINRLYDSMIMTVFDDAFTVEKRLRLNLVDDMYNYRLISVNDSVNIPYLTEGSVPNDGEIALLAPFKESHDLNVGDPYIIKGQTFVVSGFFYAPEYIVPVINASNLQYDASRDVIVLATDDTILSFNTPFRVDYQVLGDFTSLAESFDIYDILDTNLQIYGRNMQMVETVVPRALNYRIQAVTFESEFTSVFVVRFLISFFTLSLFVFMFYIKRFIDRQQSDLLILRRLGYQRKTLVFSLGSVIIVYGAIILLAMVVGLVIGYLGFDRYSARYVMPKADYTLPLGSMVIGAFIPLIVLALFILLYTRVHIKQIFTTPSLTKIKMVFSRIRHTGLEAIVFLVITSLVLISVMSSQLFSDFKDDTLDGKLFTSMMYLYHYDDSPLADDQESFIHHSVTITHVNGDKFAETYVIQGYGIDHETTLLRLEDDNVNYVPSLDDNTVLLSQNTARLHDIKKGDTITLKVGYVRQTFTVLAIVDEWMERSLYIYDETMLSMLGYDDKTLYNGYFSSSLADDERAVFRHLQYDTIVDQIEIMFYASSALIYLIMGLSMGLAVMMLYFFIYDRLQVASAYLLTLHALGYTIKETYVLFFKRMFLVFTISFIVSILISRWVVKSTLMHVYEALGFMFPFSFHTMMITSVYVGMSLVFVFSTFILYKQVAKQPLNTLLKKV